jgi:hypothetical protein
MTCQRSRRAAVAVALAGALALTTPAHAAGWDGAGFPGWFERTLERIAVLWLGEGSTPEPRQAAPKQNLGTGSDGVASSPPPAGSTTESNGATDPDG